MMAAHSYYSLRYGTLSPQRIVDTAVLLGYKAIALTDIHNTSAVPDFVACCRKSGIKALAGMEFRADGRWLYTLLAASNAGMHEINAFASACHLSHTPYPPRPGTLSHVFTLYPLRGISPENLQENEYIALQPHEVQSLFSSPFRSRSSRLILWHTVTFDGKEGFELHKILRAIDLNTLISKVRPFDLADPSQVFLSSDDLLNTCSAFPSVIRNTERLIERCTFDPDLASPKNKKTFTGNAYDDKVLLEKLALDGMRYRYGAHDSTALRRVQHELEIIDKLRFSSYFLITWDIIRYSLSRGFYHVGRGSGANSVVAYCLRITDVDPIGLNLYFERFINPKRTSPPDFDIDYSWKERDEVIDYIFKRYGHAHTALLGAMSTFKGRSIIRELGKVYGLPKSDIDRLVHQPESLLAKDSVAAHIERVGARMKNFPNLRSIHAGGILISEVPITCYTALDMPPKGFPTTQWDMYVAETIGFEKLDILSQRGIGHIQECVAIIRETHGLSVDVHRVDEFKVDPLVKQKLKEAQTIGCFYIESPAMRQLLTKLKCDDYLTLVAASSIIRPGVARSGMMREYISRFHNPGGFQYLHPIMEEQLKETYGVMVYQEDVLKVCHHFAGLDLADADVLRRAMSGKFRSRAEFQRIVDKFFLHCNARGYPDTVTQEVWRQIESFAGYSFSKAHSASYAVESFQSLYLKSYYPKEFMTAVINNFGGYYHSWVYFNEARRLGAHIAVPCVNRSYYKTRLLEETIYMGFIHIQGLEERVGKGIVANRELYGPYAGLQDFLGRVAAGVEQVVLLVRVGALRFTGMQKAALLWNVHLYFGRARPLSHLRSLFNMPVKAYTLPVLEQDALEDAYDETELLGFPVSLSWFDMLQTGYRGAVMSHNLPDFVGKKVRMAGQLVTLKYVKTVKGELMNFGCFLDYHGRFFDTIHFPDRLKYYPFRGKGVYLLLGTVVTEFGSPGLEVEKMALLPLKPDPRAAD
ncbi:MAG: DNA polymerase III subunit alpha [Bacteroidia bacterium]|nr:DNA polymerase III subunit alpha [Bacteroidia bacterium]